MRTLLTADIHLDGHRKVSSMRHLIQIAKRQHPHVWIVAGDISHAEDAPSALYALRKIAGDKPVAVTLGNHDFWLSKGKRNTSFADVVDEYWVPAARDNDIHLLDLENFVFGSTTFVGCYGHYDYGFAEPDLELHGYRVTDEHYRSGTPPRHFEPLMNDVLMLPLLPDAIKEAERQASGFEQRLRAAAATCDEVVVATHTVPFVELREGERYSNPFMWAYSGNSRIGAILKENAAQVRLAVCGHTHSQAGPKRINGILCANIGGNYKAPHAIVWDGETARRASARIPKTDLPLVRRLGLEIHSRNGIQWVDWAPMAAAVTRLGGESAIAVVSEKMRGQTMAEGGPYPDDIEEALTTMESLLGPVILTLPEPSPAVQDAPLAKPQTAAL